MMMRTIDATDDNDLEGQREMDWKYFVYLSDNSIVAAALSPEGDEIASRLSLGGSPDETLREFASEGDLLDFIVSVDQDKPRNTALADIFPAPRKEDSQ